MVNKQYNIQNINKNKSKPASPVDDSDHTQSAFERNITQNYFYDNSDAFSDLLDDNCGEKPIRVQSSQTDQPRFSVIATTDNHLNTATTTTSTTNTSIDSDSQKPLSINDIGRFQYILQMDREMVRLLHLFSPFSASVLLLLLFCFCVYLFVYHLFGSFWMLVLCSACVVCVYWILYPSAFTLFWSYVSSKW